jgi:hypothetical protein
LNELEANIISEIKIQQNLEIQLLLGQLATKDQQITMKD